MRGISMVLGLAIAAACFTSAATATTISVPQPLAARAKPAVIPAFFGGIQKKIKQVAKATVRR